MGYPMTYGRVLGRNWLWGNYTHVRDAGGNVYEGWDESRDGILKLLAGDLRRLELDTRDGGYECQRIATEAGVDIETVKRVLTAFFQEAPKLTPHDEFPSTVSDNPHAK